jgi:DNA-binding transcriptional MerR regulator
VRPHVLRFWESKFPQLKPLKRGGGRRYYRPEDIDLLRRIRQCLYHEGYTIRGVQKLLREGLGCNRPGPASPAAVGPGAALAAPADAPSPAAPELGPSPVALRAALAELRQELSQIRSLLDALLRK